MSIRVELEELAEVVGRYDFAYLLTVGDDDRPHAVALRPWFDGDVMHLSAGTRTVANARARRDVAVIYPPVDVGGMSLVIDATVSDSDEAQAADGDELVLTPTGAVLHRAAP